MHPQEKNAIISKLEPVTNIFIWNYIYHTMTTRWNSFIWYATRRMKNLFNPKLIYYIHFKIHTPQQTTKNISIFIFTNKEFIKMLLILCRRGDNYLNQTIILFYKTFRTVTLEHPFFKRYDATSNPKSYLTPV